MHTVVLCDHCTCVYDTCISDVSVGKRDNVLTLSCLLPPCAPGAPRAYNIPDRYHPEEDGAEPRAKLTVLQQHVEPFGEGYVWPCVWQPLFMVWHTPWKAFCGTGTC